MYWPHPLCCLPGIELRIAPVSSNHQPRIGLAVDKSHPREALVWEEAGSGLHF